MRVSDALQGLSFCCIPSGTIPRRTNGKLNFAPDHAKRMSNGSWKAVMPTPAFASEYIRRIVIGRISLLNSQHVRLQRRWSLSGICRWPWKVCLLYHDALCEGYVRQCLAKHSER